MNSHFTENMGLVAGILQFLVAAYALRLNRLYGAGRVGWSLFCAFSLLALVHLTQSLGVFNGHGAGSFKVELVYSLISLLLLTGMVHIETLLKERMQMEGKERELRSALESEVEKKTAYLMRAIEELQSETDERKRMETEMEKANTELFYASNQVKTAEMATTVLRNMSSMLKSVNVSASLVSDQMKQSKITNVVNIGALIRHHTADLGRFMKNDPRGQKLPQYIAELGDHLANERSILTHELESLKNDIEQILKMEQNYAQFSWKGNARETATSDTSVQIFQRQDPEKAAESQIITDRAFLVSYFENAVC